MPFWNFLSLLHRKNIKTAYRSQAIKWHPDRNPGVDTTEMMQLINEAYLILKDADARKRYDSEYVRLKQSTAREESPYTNQNQPKPPREHKKYYYPDYEIYDKTLEKWIINAGIQAIRLAKEAITEFAKETWIGVASGVKNAIGYALIVQLFFGVLFLLFFIGKACNK